MNSSIKSGMKTTEFWVSLATGIFGVLVTTGVFSPEQAAEMTQSVADLSGAIITAVAAASYGISRGLAKKDVPNKDQ